MVRAPSLDRIRRHWDRQSVGYDDKMDRAERLFGDTRAWVCRQATGEVLEVAVGTGLNLGLYPGQVTLTGMDLSPAMLDVARRRATGLGRDVDLRVGDAQRLEFVDASFDTVVCTFGLCAVPDDGGAVGEMVRVLRPGGLLLLADHVVSTSWPSSTACGSRTSTSGGGRSGTSRPPGSPSRGTTGSRRASSSA
jgi:SAM-dependent methyltransferase